MGVRLDYYLSSPLSSPLEQSRLVTPIDSPFLLPCLALHAARCPQPSDDKQQHLHSFLCLTIEWFLTCPRLGASTRPQRHPFCTLLRTLYSGHTFASGLPTCITKLVLFLRNETQSWIAAFRAGQRFVPSPPPRKLKPNKKRKKGQTSRRKVSGSRHVCTTNQTPIRRRRQ